MRRLSWQMPRDEIAVSRSYLPAGAAALCLVQYAWYGAGADHHHDLPGGGLLAPDAGTGPEAPSEAASGI